MSEEFGNVYLDHGVFSAKKRKLVIPWTPQKTIAVQSGSTPILRHALMIPKAPVGVFRRSLWESAAVYYSQEILDVVDPTSADKMHV